VKNPLNLKVVPIKIGTMGWQFVIVFPSGTVYLRESHDAIHLTKGLARSAGESALKRHLKNQRRIEKAVRRAR